jgi:hypothetical protein
MEARLQRSWGTGDEVKARARLETLINEETLLLAKYLRNEKKNGVPRICNSKRVENL